MVNDSRLYQIYTAASRSFVLKGYSQTQITDIAKEVSISTGAIYSLFVSKKSMFQFVIKCIFDEDSINNVSTLPICEMDAGDLRNLLLSAFENHFEKLFQFKDFKPLNMLPFKVLLSTVYNLIAKFGTGFLIFERNTVDWPDLCSIYFEKRKQFIDNLEKYVMAYIQRGEVRQLENPQYHTRLIVETLSWWGVHVKYYFSDISVSDTDAKSVVMDALAHAYLK